MSMTAEHARVMARYNRWMNEKLYAVAAKLTDAERKRDRGAFFGSIHRTFNHLLLADRVWLGRFTGAALQDGEMGPGGIRTLDQELYDDFDDLRRERAKTDDDIDAFVAKVTDGELAGDFRFLRRGVMNELPLWHAVAHLFNHQTHHRGQVTTLLMQAGHDPGVTDLFAMLRA
ncbi:MAG: damage-inducible protein DinB [Labilithrix sp.]|nr:damage-inducible protein DinB [Labilithrix sp.]